MSHQVLYDLVKTTDWFGQKQILKVSKFQNEFLKSLFLPKFLPKMNQKDFCPVFHSGTVQGRNPYNIWFIFWEKQWLHKFILKFTDLLIQNLSNFTVLQFFTWQFYETGILINWSFENCSAFGSSHFCFSFSPERKSERFQRKFKT